MTEAHALETRRTQATCVSPATVTYSCVKCNYTTAPFTDGDVGTEHSWGNYKTISEPTCTATGTQSRSCRLCGKSETITLEKADHKYGEWKSSDDFWHARKCENCGSVLRERHNSEVSRTIAYAQDARLGKKSFTCTGCGYMYTRLYTSTGSRLFSSEDVNEQGYIMFGTLNVEAGRTTVIRMYPAAVFSYTAIADSVIQLYANAATLEYRGISLESGEGTLALDNGPALLELLACQNGATLHAAAGENLFITGNGALMRAVDGADVITNKSSAGYKMDVYGKNACRVENGKFVSDSSPVISAVISYNPSAQRLTVNTDNTGSSLTVYGNGNVLYSGKNADKYECAISKGEISEGWYVVIGDAAKGKAYSSPVFDADGELLLMAVSAEEKPEPETESAITEEVPIEEAVEVPEILSLSSETETMVHMSPDIKVSVSGGVYTVEVSEMPEGWKVEMIRFVQRYGDTGYKLVNEYSDKASYTLLGGAGTISARVFMLDSTGDPIEYLAGSFELLGY